MRSTKTNKFTNLDRQTVQCVGFFLLFIAFNSAANLSSKAMKEDNLGNLGFISLATLYCVFAFTSFFSTAIVNKIGVRVSHVIGGLCYFFWVFCFIAPAFLHDYPHSSLFLLNKTFIKVIVILSAAVNGFGAGILWVAQGKYMSDCCNQTNKGFFMSYFWAWFMMSQVFGNLIAALVLGNGSQSTYYITMSVISFCGSMTFLLLRKPIKTDPEESRQLVQSEERLSSDQVINRVESNTDSGRGQSA